MLSTVLFDGMLGGQVWWLTQRAITRALPQFVDDNGYILGTIGLIGVWLLFLAAYRLTCEITAPARRCGRRRRTLARAFALTLVPIAVAYNVAHNFSSLLVQGQQLIPLLSDPLGLKWDLFGAATYRPDIGIIDARITWYVAISAIVTGHVISVWLAHRVALREFATPRRAVIASIPLTMLMVIYTAISLSVIAEPMVKFDVPTDMISDPRNSEVTFHELLDPRRQLDVVNAVESGHVGLDVEHRRAVERVEAAHLHHIAVDAEQLDRCHADRIGSVLGALREHADRLQVLHAARLAQQMFGRVEALRAIEKKRDENMRKALEPLKAGRVFGIQVYFRIDFRPAALRHFGHGTFDAADRIDLKHACLHWISCPEQCPAAAYSNIPRYRTAGRTTPGP